MESDQSGYYGSSCDIVVPEKVAGAHQGQAFSSTSTNYSVQYDDDAHGLKGTRRPAWYSFSADTNIRGLATGAGGSIDTQESKKNVSQHC